MRSKYSSIFIFTCLALLAATGNQFALASTATNGASLPLVSPMFGDNMVLQRGKANRFWGWAKPGQAIRVEIAGQTATAMTGPDGRWQADVQGPRAGRSLHG